jgi:methenyltetrahydromethanopterin cyclohydrolase
MISVNKRAVEIVQRMIADAEALGLAVTRLPNGTTVIDAGVDVSGSLEAGRLFAEVCLGGLGQVGFVELDLDDLWLPGVSVSVSHPPVACMAAQYAGWALEARTEKGKFVAMGSGPARALRVREPIFERLAYRDEADVAVLALEGRELPLEEVAEEVAEKCGVPSDGLYLLVAPTASVVGSVQVAARVVETGLHKMLEVCAGGLFDLGAVISGFGTCPLAPVAKDDLRAIGRTNDAVLYGGRAWYTVKADDAQIEEMIDCLPSSASRDYGTSFYELFQRYNGDFYKIDPLLFSPADVFINNLSSGRTFHAGHINGDMIRRALLG